VIVFDVIKTFHYIFLALTSRHFSRQMDFKTSKTYYSYIMYGNNL